jgi:hypothetical protein
MLITSNGSEQINVEFQSVYGTEMLRIETNFNVHKYSRFANEVTQIQGVRLMCGIQQETPKQGKYIFLLNKNSDKKLITESLSEQFKIYFS